MRNGVTSARGDGGRRGKRRRGGEFVGGRHGRCSHFHSQARGHVAGAAIFMSADAKHCPADGCVCEHFGVVCLFFCLFVSLFVFKRHPRCEIEDFVEKIVFCV